MTDPTNIVFLGEIGAVHGVRGWFVVKSYTDPIENLIDYRPWFTKRPGDNVVWEQVDEIQAMPYKKKLLAKFGGIDSRESAYALRGSAIGVARADLPDLANGDFYWIDLIDTAVFNTDHKPLGQITSFIDNGSYSLVQITNDQSEYLVPFVSPYLIEAIPGERVVLDWSEDWN